MTTEEVSSPTVSLEALMISCPIDAKERRHVVVTDVLLFWRLLLDMLIERVFTLNPYNQGVVKNLMNGKQCTVVWHVHDLKISHLKENLVK